MQATSQPLAPQTALLFGLAWQVTPQAPQFCVVSSFTQAPSQGLKPASQAMPQPAVPQVALPLATPGQAVPQPWQWAGSEAVSTQEPPQLVLPLGQSLRHLPLEQT